MTTIKLFFGTWWASGIEANHAQETELLRTSLLPKGLTYLIDGCEYGESSDKCHHQITFRLGTAVRITTMTSYLKNTLGSNVHLEPIKSLKDALIYCAKEGKVIEWGTKPVEATQKRKAACKTKFDEQCEEVQVLIDEKKFDEIPASFVFRYPNIIDKKIRAAEILSIQPLTWDPMAFGDLGCPNMWLYGPPGTGKTFQYVGKPNNYFLSYSKGQSTIWFDGWNNEIHDTLIIDDIDKYCIALTKTIKELGHHSPLNVQIKGGMLTIRPKRVIITSNLAPQEIWTEQIHLHAILRRFNVYIKEKKELPFKLVSHTEAHSSNQEINVSFSDAPLFNMPPPLNNDLPDFAQIFDSQEQVVLDDLGSFDL